MGYYIEGPALGKAPYIVETYGGEVLKNPPISITDVPEDKAIICVVNNGPFEAAGYCFSDRELQAFSSSTDPRPRVWMVMDKEKAEELTGYAEDHRGTD